MLHHPAQPAATLRVDGGSARANSRAALPNIEAAVVDWAWDLLFGTTYTLLITAVALLAAIPYGVWQGLRWLGGRLARRNDGNA